MLLEPESAPLSFQSRCPWLVVPRPHFPFLLSSQRKRGQGQTYQLVVLMDPHDDVAFHDLTLVVHAVRKKRDAVELGLLDETDTAVIAQMFRKAQPFYAAADCAQAVIVSHAAGWFCRAHARSVWATRFT